MAFVLINKTKFIEYLNRYRYSLLFFLLFALVMFYIGIALLALHSSISKNTYWNLSLKVVELITSPFSPLEDLGSNLSFSQLFSNLFLNCYYIFLAIFSVEYYYNWCKKKESVRIIFFVSVIASYLTSILWWVVYGAPSTGTSIIGLIFSLTILWLLMVNTMKVPKKVAELVIKGRKLTVLNPHKNKKDAREGEKLIIYAILLPFGYVYAYFFMFTVGLPGYFLASNAQSLSPSVPIHLTGLFIFVVLFFLNRKFNFLKEKI